ncbi:thioesterase domain-containing protein [Paractinoplanes rishiriensis]|uniref:thioesterase domain-containing protein n=1 Tax=Paractinoplanes rishiriensis TaxID=1050105 RepID=UPI0019406312|nr:thioesterase domain-containing protein [Actinoplanes rishiriensis]
MSGGKPRWLLHEPDDSAEARLFCLPYSGCGASMYRRWPRRLGGLEICPVQPPGRENRMREPAYGTYAELAADLIASLAGYFDRPFGFFGHCGSALSAYETAVQLEAAHGPQPTAVFVSSQVAPQDGPYGSYVTMSDAELRDEVGVLIRQMGGTPTPQLVELCYEVMRADVGANARYRIAEPAVLRAPVVAIGWDADTNVDHRLMGGWAACSRDPVAVVLSGAHFQFLDAPADLLDVFAAHLAGTRQTWRVTVDRDVCVGSGTCTAAAPHAFVLDDEDKSTPLLPLLEPDESVRLAVDMCPTAALRLTI